jgi:tRNA(adenine34) deaminase
MKICLDLASKLDSCEVPVAALIVDISSGEIIATGVNTRETEQSVLAHAEINALKEASKIIGSWNLSGYALYVSLEPCAMCAGAILQSHISQVIFSAYDSKTGAFGSRYNLINKNIKVTGGVLEEVSQLLLKKFFDGKRG